MELNFYSLSVLYLVYSFLGWVGETVVATIKGRRFANRGVASGPFCFIYGFTAVLLAISFADRPSPLLLFLGAMIFTSVLEYVTSWLMEKLFHSKWWDYSERPFNINGRVCLLNSLLFGIMGLAVMYVVHPFICDVFEQIPALARLITAAVLLILFIWDNIHTFHAILRENSDYRMVEDSLKELAVQFKGFQLYSLDEPLSARIQAILDQTDADERLQEALSRMQQNWHQRISAFRHTRRRLHAAFPKRAENVRLRNIRDLVNALDEHLRGRGE